MPLLSERGSAMTPDQKLAALANIINLGILAMVALEMLFDWIEVRFVDPWKERIRRGD
jgi:hypothetical protein